MKCDETSPKCNNCVRLNLKCDYSLVLKWGADALKSGKAFGRCKKSKVDVELNSNHLELRLTKQAEQIPGTWLSCSKNRYYYINFTADDFATKPTVTENKLEDGTNGNLPRSPSIDEKSQSLTVFLYLPLTQYSAEETVMFTYMVESIFPSCVCYGHKTGSGNPYLDYIVPLAMGSDVVYHSIIAAGANLYYLQTGEDYYREFSNSYIRSVIRNLPDQIHNKHASNSKSWDDILVTVLMLCFTDISSNCDKRWLEHLHSGKKLLGRQQIIEHSNKLLLKFFVRYITSHDIMWETVKDSGEEMSLDGDVGIYETFKNDIDVDVDLVLGCSPYLLTLISKTSNLGDCYEALRHESEANRELFEEIIGREAESIASELQQLAKHKEVKAGYTSLEGIHLISEIKRLTTRLYLFARIDMTWFALRRSDSSTSASFREKYAKMKRLSSTIIGLMKMVKSCTMALSWPLFVVGLVSASFEDRWFIIDKFREMESNRGLASVRLARETVEASWKRRDIAEGRVFTWNELLGSQGRTLSLADRKSVV